MKAEERDGAFLLYVTVMFTENREKNQDYAAQGLVLMLALGLVSMLAWKGVVPCRLE